MTTRLLLKSGFSIFIVLGVLVGVAVTSLVTAHGGDPETIHACVDNKGKVRIVGPDEDCSGLKGKSWELLDWPATAVDTILTETEVEDFITNGVRLLPTLLPK